MVQSKKGEISASTNWNGLAWIGVLEKEDAWVTVCDKPVGDFWGVYGKNKNPVKNSGKCGSVLTKLYKNHGMLNILTCEQKLAYICEL